MPGWEHGVGSCQRDTAVQFMALRPASWTPEFSLSRRRAFVPPGRWYPPIATRVSGRDAALATSLGVSRPMARRIDGNANCTETYRLMNGDAGPYAGPTGPAETGRSISADERTGRAETIR